MVRTEVHELAHKGIRPTPRCAMLPFLPESQEEGATNSTFAVLGS